jgi:endonuclease YncB( thermonuclease family)
VYAYRVKEVIRVVDGDTIDCRISLGFGLSAAFRFRLAGIDTPEMYGLNASKFGREAYEATKAWIEGCPDLIVRTLPTSNSTVGIGDGSFGRWAAEFISADGESLAEHLKANGHA